jgi:hypothetical protein
MSYADRAKYLEYCRLAGPSKIHPVACLWLSAP